MEIFNLVRSTWVGIFEIFLMGFCGYILVKKKFLPSGASNVISRLVTELALPFLIFSKMVSTFDFNKFSYWWILPFVSMGMILVGFLIGALFSGSIKKETRKEFLSLCAYQNSGYLILALIGSIFNSDLANTLFIYTFLFLAGFNFLMWSAGTFYLSREKESNLNFKSFFTMPFIAVLLSIIFTALGINKHIPTAVLNPISKIGASTVPLAIIAIGAILAEVEIDIKNFRKDIVFILLVKLFILPVITALVLFFVDLPKYMELFIFLESLMPSATSLGIIARRYKADYKFIANSVLVSHLCSLITIPFFTVLYYKIFI